MPHLLKFKLVLRPRYERPAQDGQPIEYYQLPITVMDSARPRQIITDVFNSMGIQIVDYQIDQSNNRLIVTIQLDRKVFMDNYATGTLDEIMDWIYVQFNDSDIKENTWMTEGNAFQFVDNATGQTFTAYLDLDLDNITQLPQLSDQVTTINPPALLPLPVPTGSLFGMSQPVNASTFSVLPGKAKVSQYIKIVGNFKHRIYIIRLPNGETFALKLKYPKSGNQKIQQVHLIYGNVDPIAKGYKIITNYTDQSEFDRVKEAVRDYPQVVDVLEFVGPVGN